mgnify:CR=1 FL=1
MSCTCARICQLAPIVGPHDVVVGRELRVHRQLAEVEDLADAAADRHGPLLAAVRLPVDGEDRAQLVRYSAAFEVVIDERLDQAVVVREPPCLLLRQRPDVVDQHAVDPRVAVLEVQHDDRRPEPPVLVAELARCCWSAAARPARRPRSSGPDWPATGTR